MFGIPSERRLEQEIQVNMAYRWFLGLDLNDPVPDHSTISQNRRRRFNRTGLFRRLFEQIIFQCMEKGLVDGNTILTDSTHVKANASAKKNIQVTVQEETKNYMKRLDFYEGQELQRLEQSEAIPPKRKAAPRKKNALSRKPSVLPTRKPGYSKGRERQRDRIT